MSADNFKKKHVILMGLHLSLQYGQVRLVSQYHVLTAVIKWMCDIRVQAPTLA